MHLRSISAKCALVLGSMALAGVGFQATHASPLPAVDTAGGGYKTSDLGYSLRSGDSSLVDEVHFRISPPDARSVRAQLVKGGPWYECSVYNGEVSCDTSGHPAEAARAAELSVIVSP